MNELLGMITYILLEDWPLIITALILGWILVDVFLPNPRKLGKIFGYIVMEFMEHIILPIAMIISMTILPGYVIAILAVFVGTLYGYVFGLAKTISDWANVTMIFFGYLFILLLPYTVSSYQYYLGFPGWTLILPFNIIIIALYVRWKIVRHTQSRVSQG